MLEHGESPLGIGARPSSRDDAARQRARCDNGVTCWVGGGGRSGDRSTTIAASVLPAAGPFAKPVAIPSARFRSVAVRLLLLLIVVLAAACGPVRVRRTIESAEAKVAEARGLKAPDDDRAFEERFEIGGESLRGRSPMYFFVKAEAFLELAKEREAYSEFQAAERYADAAVKYAEAAVAAARRRKEGVRAPAAPAGDDWGDEPAAPARPARRSR